MRPSSFLALGLGAIVLAVIAILLWLGVSRERTPIVPESAATGPRTPNLERADLAVVEQPDGRSTVTGPVPAAAPGSYYGVVVDQSGKPIAKVNVALYPTPGNWQQQEPVGSALSATDGRFVILIPGVEGAGPPLRVVAQAKGFGGFSMNPVYANKEIRIELNQEVELFGAVLDAANDAPIAGATVEGGGDSATTDEHGRYRLLPGLCVGVNYSVTTDREGYARATTSVLIGVPEPTEHVIRMHRGIPMRVQVFDEHTGEPIAGAQLEDGQGVVVGTTGGQGMFETRVVQDSKTFLRAQAAGYADCWWSWAVSDAEVAMAIRIPMVPFAWIEGTVHDENGSPIADSTLYASSDNGRDLVEVQAEALRARLPGEAYWKLPDRTSVVSDAQGKFVHPVIPGDSPYTLHAGHKDFAGATVTPILLTVPGQRASVDVTLSNGATIRGVVRYNDLPWTDGRVYCEHESGRYGGSSRIDSGGRYEMRNVPAGRVTLKLRDDLLRGGTLPTVDLVVEARKEYEQDVVWTEPLVAIRGRVLDSHGVPVKGENVDAVPTKGRRRFRGWTGEDGTFSVEVAPGSTYQVSVYRPPVGDSRSEVQAGDAGIELILPELGKLKLQLLDSTTRAPIRPRAAPAEGISWRRDSNDRYGWLKVEVDQSGSAEVVLPTGNVDLAVNWENDCYVAREMIGVQVTREGNSDPLVIDLERGASVKLVLRGEGLSDLLSGHGFVLAHKFDPSPAGELAEPGGLTLNGVKVSIEGGRYERLLDFTSDGVVVLDGLDLGRKEVIVLPDDISLDPPTFEAREPMMDSGERPTVEIHLRRK